MNFTLTLLHFFRRNFSIPICKIHFLVFSIFTFVSANAQFSQLNNYNVKDGLPSSDVYSMLQDAHGYLWFTTDMGVSRFNGYEFKNFSTENGLADNTNFGILEDTKGRIWFRSFSGKLSYFENEKIKTPSCNSGLVKLLATALISSIYVDKGDTIWLGINRERILQISPPWNIENAKFLQLNKKGAYIILFSESNFIFGGSSPDPCDLTVYDNHLKELYEIPLHIKPIIEGFIRFSFSRLSDHSFVGIANNVITHFNSKGIISQKTNNSIFLCVLEGENHKVFAGSYVGIKQFTDSALTDDALLAHLNKKTITAICRDHENGLWFCTEGNGIFYIPFRNFLYYSPADGLSESKISCVAKAGDKVFCGHFNGTVSILENQHVKNLVFNNDTSSSESSNRTTSLAYNGKDILYISSMKNVFALDIEKQIANKRHTVGSKSIILAADKNIWSLQFNILYKYSPEPIFKKITEVRIGSYSDNIFEDHLGKVWICPTNSVWT